MNGIDIVHMITQHEPNLWVNKSCGDVHTVMWASVREVVSIGDHSAWLGSARQFAEEFIEAQ